MSNAEIITKLEKLTPMAGEEVTEIKHFSVVVGSFYSSQTASSLKNRMQNEGYMPVLAQNENGLVRVILTAHDSRTEAEKSCSEIQEKYFPNFQDAWILERSF